jgi:hypothetical protein
MFEPGFKINSSAHCEDLAGLGYPLSSASDLMMLACKSRVSIPYMSLRLNPLEGVSITHAVFIPKKKQ